jgi:uncharacterized protein DUF5648
MRPSPAAAFRRFLALLLAGTTACALQLAPAPARAQLGVGAPVPVVEFFNTFLGHYFMTADGAEIASLEAGAAGPGWVRTGWSFTAFSWPPPATGTCIAGGCAPVMPVRRFYGTPGLGPNSHFYTADGVEAGGLDRPGTGWTFEKVAFGIPVPDAPGQCPGASLTPVYRLYNDRAASNDSNHRYVTSAAERARMRAMGWIDEGVRFCAYAASDAPVKSFAITHADGTWKVRAGPDCEDESLNIGSCIGVNNLPVPRFELRSPLLPPGMTAPGVFDPRLFSERTGLATSVLYVPDVNVAPQEAARDVFVQRSESDDSIGIHVDTRRRGPNALSNVNPVYQMHTSAGPGRRDDRFFPFGAYESDVELQVAFSLHVKRIEARGEGSAAFGHPTLEFIDQRSGHHLYFTALAYGTPPTPADLLAPDTFTGKVIVGTTLREGSPYLRNLGLTSRFTPSGFAASDAGAGGDFEFRMDRAHFQRVLDDARTLDAALSANPADYLIDNFHFNNEVGGEGEIGLTLHAYRLRLLRR